MHDRDVGALCVDVPGAEQLAALRSDAQLDPDLNACALRRPGRYARAFSIVAVLRRVVAVVAVLNPRVDLVKRCIALAGDSVEVLKKQLYINGERADEHLFVQHVDPRVVTRRTPYNAHNFKRDNFGPFTVPEGHYFCLGDNRDRSKDSRYWGPVPAHYLKGRAVAIYWSYGGEPWDGQTHDVGTRVSQLAGTVLGFFTKTRWERSFQTVR